MVSRYVGAREFEKAYRLSMQNLRITVVINIMISVLILIFGLYTKFYALPIVTLEKEHDS